MKTIDELNQQLLSASSQDDVLIVDNLLSNGASTNARDKHQHTPLHLAARSGCTAVISRLLIAGASHQDKNQNNNTPLHSEAYCCQNLSIIMLLDHGASLTAINKDGDTPLHSAAWKGHALAIKTLASRGSDLNARNLDGDTALHLAAWNNHIAAIEILAFVGADLEIANNDGETAIHLAARKGHVSALKMLIGKGACLDAKDTLGRTFLQLDAWKKFVCAHIKMTAQMLTLNYLRNMASPSSLKELDAFLMLINNIEGSVDIMDGIKSDLIIAILSEFGSFYPESEKNTLFLNMIDNLKYDTPFKLPSFQKEISTSTGYQQRCSVILTSSRFFSSVEVPWKKSIDSKKCVSRPVHFSL